MIANKTTLIVGAGASVDLDYPTGSGLRKKIIDGHWRLDLFGDKAREMQKRLSNRLRNSLISSIDAFLAEQENEDLREIGVLAIAGALIPCESLKIDTPPEWLRILFNEVRHKTSAGRSERLKIVTFNYDLSIEYFLYRAFQAAYKLTEDETRQRFNDSVEIIHVYGQLGQILELGGDRQYGGKLYAEDVFNAANQLKIIGRQPADAQFARAQAAIEEADFLGVLGFGYDPVNVANLRLAEIGRHKRIFSTGWDLGYGMRGWIRHIGLKAIIMGGKKESVADFLQNSGFFHWANTPGATSDQMYNAIADHLKHWGRGVE